MVGFGGWSMPVQYPGGILAEHRAVRPAAGEEAGLDIPAFLRRQSS